MFKNLRKSKESETIRSTQYQQEPIDTFLVEHRRQFNQAMESQKKASNLMEEAFSFMLGLCTQQSPAQYEQAKIKLVDCLKSVQEDETLKRNSEVQKLVKDIYANMDDKKAMMEMMGRLQTLVGTPQVPDILISLNF